jgi:molybdopterin-biosynthesis enzyme MoeA-like protein
MLPQLKEAIVSGKKIISLTCDAKVRESSIALDLSAIQNKYPDIDIGSYPYSKESGFGTILVMRAIDEVRAIKCKAEVEVMLKKYL